QDFRPLHHETAIGSRHDRSWKCFPEARPARAAVELGRRAEQSIGAAGADEGAAAVLLQERAGERTLGRRFAEHRIALVPKNPPPFCGRVTDWKADVGPSSARAAEQDQAARRGNAGHTK